MRKNVDEIKIEEIFVLIEPKDAPPPSRNKYVNNNSFKCLQCDEKLDTQNFLPNHMICEHEAEGEIFSWDICDFSTFQ